MVPVRPLSGAATSLVGTGIVLYGKKIGNIMSIVIGLSLMIVPMMVHSILWMWLIAFGSITGLYTLSRFA